MVVVRLTGGLGNQLFQYATGRRLSQALQSELRIDLSYFTEDIKRNYSLDFLNVHAKPISPYAARLFRETVRRGSHGQIARLGVRLFSASRWKVLFEPRMGPVAETVTKAKGNIYLAGYWQSEKYFDDIRCILLDELTLRDTVLKSRETFQLIKNTESVSLHVRRGDYVTEKHTNESHGICELDYYRRCIDLIVQQQSRPYFFIFSDDLEWCRANLTIPYPTIYVENNGQGDILDLYLMSQCKHNIIANSSFSWWGAWLNRNQGKTVLAPREWFKDKTMDTQDLLPESWIKV